jgi:hypothetical protein
VNVVVVCRGGKYRLEKVLILFIYFDDGEFVVLI